MPKENYEYPLNITDNPYIDLLVQITKTLGMNCIVKNENEALKYEDIRSRTESIKLLKYKDGYWKEERDGYFSENLYMEWNSYYRMLAGLPPAYTKNDELAYIESIGGKTDSIYEDIGIAYIIPELYQRYWISMDDYIDDIPEENRMFLNFEGRYLHQLNESEIDIIDSLGILDKIKSNYTDTHYRYIYHLRHKIDFYTARKAENFSLLYLPDIGQFDVVVQKFRRMFDRNRKYTMSTIYSEAYRFGSYHYDNFILILIIIQTMVDIISEVQEYIINKDVFDTRTIRYLFESYGIDYYKEIPVMYQIRIIKNVNLLLKYKSSNRNITDIIELFDNPDVTVYTYYLMKVKAIPKNEFRYYEYDDINPKYDTNTNYYIASTETTNNRYPVINVPLYDIDKEYFNTYIVNIIDTFRSFYENFLDSYNWFGVRLNKKNYLDSITNIFKNDITGDSETKGNLINIMNRIYDKTKSKTPSNIFKPNFNRYWTKCIKFSLLILLGIFDEDKYYSDVPDDELLSEGVIDYRTDKTLSKCDLYFFRDVRDKNYSKKYKSLCIFDNISTFNQTIISLGADDYITKINNFVTSYYSEFLTCLDLTFKEVSQYTAWLDINDVRSQIKDPIAGVTLNMKVTTIGHPTMPVYNDAILDNIVTYDMLGHEYYTKNYDLCFLRVPILEPNSSSFIEDYSARRSYDNITLNDPFWDGVSTYDLLTEEERGQLHESKKKEILNKEFSIERTKYISVEASIDLTKMSYQLSYFMNMLYDKHIDEELLKLRVNKKLANNPVRLNDLMTFSIALNYLYNGVAPDNIASDMERNMTINGFDFDTDWTDIYNNLNNKLHIYNNYLNDIHDYIVPDTNIVQRGYGLEKMEKGWLAETEESGLNTPLEEENYGAFLSGRYEKCGEDCYDSLYYDYDFGYSKIWENMKYKKVIDIFNDYSEYTRDKTIGVMKDDGTIEYKTFSYPTYLESMPNFYNDIENILGKTEEGYDYHIIDITWETPYQSISPENNSHGNFINTEVLNDENMSDLERFNKLKQIYYTNTNLYDHLTYMMRTAESKRMYDIYSVVFESFMETKMNHEFYNLKDSTGNLIYEDDNGTSYKLKEITSIMRSNGNVVYASIEDTSKLYYLYRNAAGTYFYYKCSDSIYDNNEYECDKDANGNYIYDDYGSYYPNNPKLEVAYDTRYVYIDVNGNQIEAIYDEDTGIATPISGSTLHPKLAKDYYEFLQSRNTELYDKLIDIKYNYKTLDDQRTRINELCEYIIDALQVYFDTNEWKYIYNLIPTANLELIQRCVLKVVMFFKSWKTQLLDQSINYIIDDPNQNYVHILDDMYYNSSFNNLSDKPGPRDYWGIISNKDIKDKYIIGEDIDTKIVYYEPYTVKYNIYDKMYGNNFDYMDYKTVTSYRDIIRPDDRVEIRPIFVR